MTHYEYVSKVITKQTDPRFPRSFQRFGCRVQCLLAIPQFITGSVLSVHGIESILLHALEDPDVVGEHWTAGNDEHWFINEAFRRLGSKRKGRQVGWTDEHITKRDWEYMIVHWVTDGPDGHFTLFDKRQVEIYDPHDPKQAGYEINKKEIDRKLVYRTWEI
jgi:hypothetical protein